MGGLRWDHSNIYGGFVTPRMHLKYSPNDKLTLRGSIEKGYRTIYVMAEYNYLLASSRQIIIDENLDQEEAWNYGVSAHREHPHRRAETGTERRVLFSPPSSTKCSSIWTATHMRYISPIS